MEMIQFLHFQPRISFCGIKNYRFAFQHRFTSCNERARNLPLCGVNFCLECSFFSCLIHLFIQSKKSQQKGSRETIGSYFSSPFIYIVWYFFFSLPMGFILLYFEKQVSKCENRKCRVSVVNSIIS